MCFPVWRLVYNMLTMNIPNNISLLRTLSAHISVEDFTNEGWLYISVSVCPNHSDLFSSLCSNPFYSPQCFVGLKRQKARNVWRLFTCIMFWVESSQQNRYLSCCSSDAYTDSLAYARSYGSVQSPTASHGLK